MVFFHVPFQKKEKVILADDHELVLSGLEGLLNLECNCEVLAKCKTGRDLLQTVDAIPCDLVIADFSMPEINGLEALIHIKNRKPSIKTLLLTGFDEHEFITTMIKRHNIDGYIKKTELNSNISKIIEDIFSGKQFYSAIPEIETPAFERIKSQANNPFAILSKKELEVVTHLASGLKYKEIAEKLRISINTLETHRNNISKKMGKLSTVEIVRLAHVYGIAKTEGIIGLQS